MAVLLGCFRRRSGGSRDALRVPDDSDDRFFLHARRHEQGEGKGEGAVLLFLHHRDLHGAGAYHFHAARS